jgi:hypothetical protein
MAQLAGWKLSIVWSSEETDTRRDASDSVYLAEGSSYQQQAPADGIQPHATNKGAGLLKTKSQCMDFGSSPTSSLYRLANARRISPPFRHAAAVITTAAPGSSITTTPDKSLPLPQSRGCTRSSRLDHAEPRNLASLVWRTTAYYKWFNTRTMRISRMHATL